jgi:hypothetical protein
MRMLPSHGRCCERSVYIERRGRAVSRRALADGRRAGTTGQMCGLQPRVFFGHCCGALGRETFFQNALAPRLL